jgi:hypothetical protein
VSASKSTIRSDKRKTYILNELEVYEVSLVKSPANGRSFYLTKAADKELKMTDEKILAVLDTPAENESKLDAILKAEMSEDAVRAVRAAMRLLDAFKDEIPSDTLAGLAEAAGMDHRMEMQDEEKGYKMEKKAEQEPAELLKSADLPEDLRPALEQLWKSNEEQRERVAQLESVLKEERDAQLLAKETERVTKSFAHVPGLESDKLAAMLIELRKAAPEVAGSVEDILTSTERAMIAKDSGAFEEAGTTTTEPAAASAWGRIEAQASEIVKKGEADSQAQAIDHVLKTNPELYAAYLAEK